MQKHWRVLCCDDINPVSDCIAQVLHGLDFVGACVLMKSTMIDSGGIESGGNGEIGFVYDFG